MSECLSVFHSINADGLKVCASRGLHVCGEPCLILESDYPLCVCAVCVVMFAFVRMQYASHRILVPQYMCVCVSVNLLATGCKRVHVECVWPYETLLEVIRSRECVYN